MRVIVHIVPRQGQLDPQGSTIQNSLHHLGFDNVAHAQYGKQITLTFSGNLTSEQVLAQTHKMCEELLANPVTEEYRIELDKDA